jgi:hypothetical protein
MIVNGNSEPSLLNSGPRRDTTSLLEEFHDVLGTYFGDYAPPSWWAVVLRSHGMI